MVSAQLHLTKSPGPNGMSALFFQKYWSIVGTHVSNMALNVLNFGMTLFEINRTNIVLVPKTNNPQRMIDFRPISLCNTIYKIVTKILVNQLKHLMPTLVSSSQTAFVLGRRGTDNVITAQELVYTIEQKKGKEGFMIIKIDLEKAYDRLEWSFVRSMLVSLGFHSDTVELILSCISTTSVALLFNGDQIGKFVLPVA